MADRVGQELGNYRLIRLLGRGGFAEVYLGEHLHLKTQAAIKVLYTHLADQDMEGFLTEARTVARLEHPHIVRVLDFDVQDGTAFLVMSYASQGNLRQRHPKGFQLPLTTIVDYVKQITDALQYAHNEKVIHRDIKPENMLLGQQNEIQLSDFGIALIAQSSRYQSIQEVVGTAHYMSPEQFQGKPRFASDQYSLGIVVYEWFAGDRPFHGTFTELYSQHLFMPPPPLHEKVSTVSRKVEQVVLTALEKDPHRRFANVETFAAALKQACQTKRISLVGPLSEIATPKQSKLSNNPAVSATSTRSSQPTSIVTLSSLPPSPIDAVTSSSQMLQPTVPAIPSPTPAVLSEPQPSKGSISRRTLLIGLTSLGLAVTGGIALVTWLGPQTHNLKTPTHTTRNTPFYKTPQPTSAQKNSPGTTIEIYHGHSDYIVAVAWSPDGKYIVSGSQDKTAQVWEATTGNLMTTYKGHNEQVSAVAWSPDGKHIVSGAIASDQVWEATTGNLIIKYTQIGNVHSLAWSLDGKYIVSADGDGTAQVWEATTGNLITKYGGHNKVVVSVAWSPDGKYIVSGGSDNTAQVWEATTGNLMTTYKGHNNLVRSVAWSPEGKYIVSGADNSAHVWEATTGKLVTKYTQMDNVLSNAWSPHGKYIVSAGQDKTAHVWEATTGRKITDYTGHSDWIVSVAWSLDGKYIASGSFDQTAQVWIAPQ